MTWMIERVRHVLQKKIYTGRQYHGEGSIKPKQDADSLNQPRTRILRTVLGDVDQYGSERHH